MSSNKATVSNKQCASVVDALGVSNENSQSSTLYSPSLERPLIAIRDSVLQYASHVLEAKKSVLERIQYLIYQYDIRYTTGTPGLFEPRLGTLRRSLFVWYSCSTSCPKCARILDKVLRYYVYIWYSRTFKTPASHRSGCEPSGECTIEFCTEPSLEGCSKVCPVERPQAESPMEFLYSTCIQSQTM